ncbi:MAG: DUF2121 domain-containing protein [Methanomicrobiales archaeon]|nr:DUF2121 domain-containing protein [Methanomicrobiales archaeon]
MSLVIAYTGSRGAIMAGDLREIRLGGDTSAIADLETELYSGTILDDEQLKHRAAELGIMILIRDDKEKVRERDGTLIGEVTESERGILRIRRLYVTAGHYAIADIEGSRFVMRGRGDTSTFVVLGNELTRQIAHAAIRQYWKNGTLEDAVRVIVQAMEEAATRTASVSRRYLLIQTKKSTDLDAVIGADRKACTEKDDAGEDRQPG